MGTVDVLFLMYFEIVGLVLGCVEQMVVYTMYIVLCTDCTLCTLCIDCGTGLVWYLEQMVVYRNTAHGDQEQEQENRGKYDRGCPAFGLYL